MKSTILLLLTFVLSISITAQNLTLSGRVLDDQEQPISFANVILYHQADSAFVKGTVTADDGSFTLVGLERSAYRLTVSNLGYEPYEKMIEQLQADQNLGTIILSTATATLDELVVTAEKPIIQVLADKTVFNVENTINATGNNGWELLRKAPGVIIDNNGGIILEGKTGVQIFIDDKASPLRGQDLQAYLQSLQSTDIESIELITQPSSKYDAAGSAGIINIRLKKDKSLGTNGTANAGVTVGDYARYNASVSFNIRTRRSNLYGSYSNRIGQQTGFLYLFREQNGTAFDAQTNSVYDWKSNNFRLGYDYFASAQSTFGIILNTNLNNSASINNSRTPIRPIGSTVFDSILIANNRGDSELQNYSVNLNYKFADTLGHSLNIDADYGDYTRANYTFQPNFYYDGNETVILSQNITAQDMPIDISIAALKADYEQPWLAGTFGAGFKLSYVKTDNVFDFFNQVNDAFILNPEQSNQFAYTENINAAYVNYNRKWDQWNVQFGLRVENTISDGNLTSTQTTVNNQVKRNYVNWFPSGGLTYQYNRKNQFAINYSKRIERPNYASLNPFVRKIDELSSGRGNPFLQPQYINNVKLSHTYNYRLTTSLSYSYITDFIAQITEVEGENRNFISPRNIANQRVVNIGVSYPATLTDWWSLYLSLNAYRSSYEALNADFVARTQETLSFYAQHTFQLPRSFSMEVSGWYSSPSVWGGTYETKALGSLNLAFQKKILDDKLNLRLSFNDVLFTSPWQGTTRFGNLFIDGTGGSDSRNVAFSISYNFGNKEVKKARRRDTGVGEEQDRI